MRICQFSMRDFWLILPCWPGLEIRDAQLSRMRWFLFALSPRGRRQGRRWGGDRGKPGQVFLNRLYKSKIKLPNYESSEVGFLYLVCDEVDFFTLRGFLEWTGARETWSWSLFLSSVWRMEHFGILSFECLGYCVFHHNAIRYNLLKLLKLIFFSEIRFFLLHL